MGKLIGSIFFFLCLGKLAFCYEGPSPLVDIKVGGSVNLDSANGVYRYSYTLSNPAKNDGAVESLDIFIRRDLNNDAELSDQGLTHCAHHANHLAQMILQKKIAVPVGSQAPANWS